MYHNKIAQKAPYNDLCYPKIKLAKIKSFVNTIKTSKKCKEKIKESLINDPRFFLFCGENKKAFKDCYLTKKLHTKLSRTINPLIKYGEYICLNIKPKTLLQSFGINNTQRNIGNNSKTKKIIIETIKKHFNIFDCKSKVLHLRSQKKINIKNSFLLNFQAVRDCKFVITSQNGFSILPTLFGKDKIELYPVDFSTNLQTNSFVIFPKIFINKREISIKKLFSSSFFYHRDNKTSIYKIKLSELSPLKLRQCLKRYLNYIFKKKSRIYNTKKIVKKHHLYCYHFPFKILNSGARYLSK